MQSDTYKQRCIPTVKQIHTNHRNFTADWPWSGSRHLCLLRWCAWTVLTSLCVWVCAHWCTLHMNCVLRCWCPPAPCRPIAGSGRLFGRYPQWKAARNELVQQPKEKRMRKCSMGERWILLLIAVCPILPAQGKSLFLLWLNHSLLPSLHCRDESPFVTLLRFPPSCSFSFPSVSITKTVKSTSGVIIAYIFLAMSVCALAPYFQSICFWGSRREISVELWDYTCKSATCRLKKRQKKKRKATEGERDEGLQIQISRMTSEVCDFSAVTCLRDHLSTGCFMR